MRDLAVVIPARNERWLNLTVADVLEHRTADTEVIVILDGEWPEVPLPQHERLTVVFLPESIGQRAATNLGIRIADARFVMKLDAHCSVAQGFDAELIKAAGELWTNTIQIPAQHNLHVFDWVCACGQRIYQGPTPDKCSACGGAMTREVVWKPRRGVRTTAWRFDSDLKFQYFGDFANRPEGKGELTETMSCLGACWFIERDWFLSLGGLDERHGSWGQMGTELACKAWLSGGRMVTNQRTWFAHMFRTQGGDFSFPYPLSGKDVEAARRHSRKLWLEDGWPQATRPLSWLIDHFAPVPGWDKAPAIKTSKTPHTKGLVYYSDCLPEPRVLDACRDQLLRAAYGLPLVSVTLQPVPGFGVNRHLPLERGYLAMFQQILTGLEALDTDVAFLTEHDVLYHASHFTHTPEGDKAYNYNANVWKVDAATGRALHYRCNQTSGLCADRQLLVNHYRARVQAVAAHGYKRNNGFEPGTRQVRHGGFDDYGHTVWMSDAPNIDIRHGKNLTPSRWSQDEFRNKKYCEGWTEAHSVPGWGHTFGRVDAFLAEISSASLVTA